MWTRSHLRRRAGEILRPGGRNLFPRSLGAFLAASVLGALPLASTAFGAEPPPPELTFQAPEELSRRAREVASYDPNRLRTAMRLAGLTEPGPPIPVVLAAEGSAAARRVPSWVSGYALGAAGPVILLVERAPSYPDRSLEALLHHEVTHVLIDRAARGHPVPRWYHEGVAMAAARAWNLEDRTRFAYQTLAHEAVPLAQLDRWFSDPGRVSAAYALAGAFVRDLLQEHGPQVTGRILAGIGRGEPFREAFLQAAGEPLRAAEARFWSRHGGWHRWVPFITSSVALWMLVTALALAAIWRRRRRDAELYAQWEEQERWAAFEAADDEHDRDGGDEWVN